jgi:hypothetical protein
MISGVRIISTSTLGAFRAFFSSIHTHIFQPTAVPRSLFAKNLPVSHSYFFLIMGCGLSCVLLILGLSLHIIGYHKRRMNQHVSQNTDQDIEAVDNEQLIHNIYTG